MPYIKKEFFPTLKDLFMDFCLDSIACNDCPLVKLTGFSYRHFRCWEWVRDHEKEFLALVEAEKEDISNAHT